MTLSGNDKKWRNPTSVLEEHRIYTQQQIDEKYNAGKEGGDWAVAEKNPYFEKEFNEPEQEIINTMDVSDHLSSDLIMQRKPKQ